MNEPVNDATVVNRSPKPPGTLPRNAQTWIIAAISVVMVAAIALSGNGASRTASPKAVTPSATAIPDPNAQRIAEYRLRIEEQARRLAAEQAALAQSKQTFANDVAAANAPVVQAQPATPPPVDEKLQQRRQIEAEREKREYLSLFASNVALTHRRDEPRLPPTVPPSDIAGLKPGDAPAAVPPPTETERAPSAVSSDGAGRKREQPNLAGLQEEGKRHRLLEGTVIEAVLTNRLDGALSGPVNCMITTDVYTRDRQQLLVPRGTRALGEVRPVSAFGQQRLAVTFHRLIMPDGFSVNLDEFAAMNQIGETGLRDKVDRHYLQTFGVSIAIGAIAGLAQANTRYGFDVSAADAYRQGVSGSVAQSSLRILDRYLNILPTFTIREGHRIKIYLAGDLLLPAYDRHRLPSDL
jgi:type IV secretion system protein VirB10